jgi:glycosyltransferase involved in cell wall biosynthesis
MYRKTVSVIIPYYRASQTIARAVESALGQTVRPLEILIVDDGSPEDAAEATKQFGSSVTVIRKPNGGAASARNLGIEHAKGEWIAFLDADDYWEPAKLERQLASSEGVGLVGSRWYTEDPGKPRSMAKIEDPEFFGRMFRALSSEAFRVAMDLFTSVVLVRRSALGDQRFDSGLLRPQISTSYPSHSLLTFNCLAHSPIAILIGIVEACSRSCIVMPHCSGQRVSVNKKRSFTELGQAVIWRGGNRERR